MTFKLSSRMGVVVGLLAILMMVTTACSSSAGTTGTGDEAGPADTGGGGEAAEFDLDAILANAGGDCQEPTGDPLIIGYVADFSELGGFADVPGTQAADYMVELINCAGGLNGTPIEYIVFPADALDLDLTLRAGQDAVDAGVHAVLGPPFSDVGLPLLNVLGGQIPVINVASTEVVLADPDSYSFLMTITDEIQGNAAGEWAAENGYQTAVTMTSDVAPYFEANPTAFAAAFQANGGELLGDYSYALGDDDYSSQVNEIAALDPPPDVLYTANIMPFIDVLAGQLRAAGLTDMVIMGPDGFDATRVIDGTATDGAIYTTHGFPSPGSRMQIFLDAYEADRGEALESIAFGPLAADSILVISQAYLATGGQLDSVAIGDAMLEHDSFELISVDSASYKRPEGANGVPTRGVYVVQNVAGVPTLLEELTPRDYSE